MTLDKVIEIKVKPPVYPFEQALNEGTHHSATCQLNQHIYIQFPVINGSLDLYSMLEDSTQRNEIVLTNRRKFPVNLNLIKHRPFSLLQTRTKGIPLGKGQELLKR